MTEFERSCCCFDYALAVIYLDCEVDTLTNEEKKTRKAKSKHCYDYDDRDKVLGSKLGACRGAACMGGEALAGLAIVHLQFYS